MQTIDERVASLETRADLQALAIQDIGRKIDRLDEKLVARPSWVVAVALTFLSSLCVGLAVALATLPR